MRWLTFLVVVGVSAKGWAQDFAEGSPGFYGNYEDGRFVILGSVRGSPADAIGIDRGDVLVSVDGQKVEDIGHAGLIEHAFRGQVGTPVKVTILLAKDQKEQTYFIKRESWPGMLERSRLYSGMLGLSLQKQEGVYVIRGVMPNSPAAQAGIQPQQRLLKIGGRLIADLPIQEINRLTRQPEGTPVTLEVEDPKSKQRRELTVKVVSEEKLLQISQKKLEDSLVGIGAVLSDVEGACTIINVLKDSPAGQARLAKGDVILKVDDQDISGKKLVEIVNLIRGEPDSEVKLLVKKAGAEEKVKTLTLNRKKIEMQNLMKPVIEQKPTDSRKPRIRSDIPTILL